MVQNNDINNKIKRVEKLKAFWDGIKHPDIKVSANAEIDGEQDLSKKLLAFMMTK